MPYITIPIAPKTKQITFDDLLNGFETNNFVPSKDTRDTRTWFRTDVSPKILHKTNFQSMISALDAFVKQHETLIDVPDKSSLYYTFLREKRGKGFAKIVRDLASSPSGARAENISVPELMNIMDPLISNHPCRLHSEIERRVVNTMSHYLCARGFYCSPDKVSQSINGAYRRIDAPNDELKSALTQFKELLENTCYASYHTSAFAYINGRSTVDCVKRHQSNGSNWFLKLDFSKFFPSTTPEFLVESIGLTYPFSHLFATDCKNVFARALQLCFLNGGLPQGTPTSPLLTNMMMIPIDYTISKYCRQHDARLCYTRYADDIIISSQYKFDWNAVQNDLVDILRKAAAPFAINAEKTRFGSTHGRSANWMLGAMINGQNQVSIGHKKRNAFKTMIFQFMKDFENHVVWTRGDVRYMLGLHSYYRMIEPQAIDRIVESYSSKFKRDILQTAKMILRS